MQDLLRREKAANGEESRKRLQLHLLTTDHLDDVTVGLPFLKKLDGIDPDRIAIAGHSFGGQLTLLAAARDRTVRAAVTFAAGAQSWENWPELRDCLQTGIRKTTVPLLLIHSANDYSIAPGKAMDDELASLGKPHLLKIYPPVGKTPDEGHNSVYTATDAWEDDVFQFLDQHLKGRRRVSTSEP
jgi:dipeptidyl aminopeptidase/acylaminoacyl peptidase